ncbi:MAG: nucleotidyltransferase family protein [Coleofasciculus sp. G1-WW12-02]|uniref:nucleotidyltransferase family protein n=1 Tax=Coleofasciculus sp. G1-WW12-02 TaxID=3068483 RepID=UPI0032F1D4C5
MNSSAVGLIILAAGASTRMGTPKQLLDYQGRSFIRHTAEVAIASVCQPIIVVLGAYAERIQPELSDLPVQVVKNQQWREGMSASIQVGLNALLTGNPHLEAIAIALCDQPFVSSQTLNHLVEAYRSTGQPIIASEYAGTLGVPVLFNNTLFPELMALKTTEGAKKLIQNYYPQVFSIPFSKGAIDIDTPKDYEQLFSPIDYHGQQARCRVGENLSIQLDAFDEH